MKTDEREEALKTIQGMTKHEIITWLAGESAFFFRPPSKSLLLFARYEAVSNKIQERRKKNKLAEGVAANLDALRRDMNNAKDHDEYMAIARKAMVYEKQWNAWIAETQAIQKEDEKLNKLYAEYEAQHKLEMAAIKSRQVMPEGEEG